MLTCFNLIPLLLMQEHHLHATVVSVKFRAAHADDSWFPASDS